MWMTTSTSCGKRAISLSLTTCEVACAAMQRRVAVEPEVQIQEDVVGRAARSDLLAAEHARHRLHDARGRRARRSRSDRPRMRDASCAMLQHAWPMNPATSSAASGSRSG